MFIKFVDFDEITNDFYLETAFSLKSSAFMCLCMVSQHSLGSLEVHDSSTKNKVLSFGYVQAQVCCGRC